MVITIRWLVKRVVAFSVPSEIINSLAVAFCIKRGEKRKYFAGNICRVDALVNEGIRQPVVFYKSDRIGLGGCSITAKHNKSKMQFKLSMKMRMRASPYCVSGVYYVIQQSNITCHK